MFVPPLFAARQSEAKKPTYTPINIADMETLEQQASLSFRDLGIQDRTVLKNIKKLGIDSPTDVQVSAIRGLLSEDRDVIIHAHTGSGKTLAYLLPLIAATDPDSNALQVRSWWNLFFVGVCGGGVGVFGCCCGCILDVVVIGFVVFVVGDGTVVLAVQGYVCWCWYASRWFVVVGRDV